jgi:hypothetical protein
MHPFAAESRIIALGIDMGNILVPQKVFHGLRPLYFHPIGNEIVIGQLGI